MKEVKFRNYSDRVGMEYVDDFYWFKESNIHTSDDCNLMFFTGLLDKNGKEIYEGDIYVNTWRSYSVVQWRSKEGRQVTGHGQTEREIKVGFELTYVPDNIEIVGNIYENPELLEKEKQ